jgi:hypothetical protein
LLFAIVLLFSVFFWGGWLRRNFSPNNVADSCVFISKQEFSREFYGQLFVSQYAVGTGDNHLVLTKSISRSSQQVIDRRSKEILGELVTLNVYPGRFDGLFLKLSGSGPVIWHCGDVSSVGEKMNYSDLVISTIKLPKQ